MAERTEPIKTGDHGWISVENAGGRSNWTEVVPTEGEISAFYMATGVVKFVNGEMVDVELEDSQGNPVVVCFPREWIHKTEPAHV